MSTCSKSCGNGFSGLVAGAVLLALFYVVPLLLALTGGIWEILLIILVVLVVLLALSMLFKALFSLLLKYRHWT